MNAIINGLFIAVLIFFYYRQHNHFLTYPRDIRAQYICYNCP